MTAIAVPMIIWKEEETRDVGTAEAPPARAAGPRAEERALRHRKEQHGLLFKSHLYSTYTNTVQFLVVAKLERSFDGFVHKEPVCAYLCLFQLIASLSDKFYKQ